MKLPKLNDVEQMLIAKVQPYMRIVHLQGGGIGYQGSILNVEQDISGICNVLPNLPQEIPLFFVRKPVRSSSTGYKDYVINKRSILIWLHFLKRNNKHYRDINLALAET